MTAEQSQLNVDAGITSAFGRVRMGYLVVNSAKLQQWRGFLQDTIGLALAADSKDHLGFRMDTNARCLIVEQGSQEDITCLGLHVDDEQTMSELLERLRARKVPVTFDEGAAAARRGVDAFYGFTGPKGLRIELFTRAKIESTPPAMLCEGFVTGDGGFGHVSLMSRDPGRTIEFWQSLFDARLSDTISIGSADKKILDVSFLRLNQRHHSVAIAATRGIHVDMFRTRIQHVNFEVATLDDLSSAFERCRQHGCKLARNIGQHPNDRELSFYVRTPSGFDLEIGWNALTVDETTWEHGRTYDAMSTWGHDIPGLIGSELEFSHLVHAIKSTRRDEHFPW